MVSVEVHSNLSGHGKIAFTNAGATFGFRCGLTAFGNSEPMEVADFPRLHRIGYVSVYEYDTDTRPGELTAFGPYMREPIWVQFRSFTHFRPNNVPFELSGLDGFVYFFYPGITANISWYY